MKPDCAFTSTELTVVPSPEVERPRSAPIERASAADLALLAMETGGAVPEHLGAVFVLDAARGFDVGSAQRVLADRIRAVPRLRQRLVRPPLGCGRPVWVDDPGFDPARHMRLRRCATPGDGQALLDVAADVISEPLPRSCPLWAAVFVSGLVGGQVGLVLVLHHVLADGIDGLAILARLVDEAEPGPTRTFPQPCPMRRRLAAEAFRSRLRSLGRLGAGARALRPTMAGGSGGPVPRAVACSILHVTGTRRRFAAVRAELAPLRAAGRRHGGTVNDVLLTAVGGALHTLLERRGEHVEAFRVAVMVAGRRSASAEAPGNQAVPLLVDVPGTGTPAERLERMSGAGRAARGSTADRPPVAVPPTLLRLLAEVGLYRLYMRHQHRLHTLVSNVRGPDRPLTFAGAPVTALIPVAVAEAGNLTVTVVALSYAGTLTVTITADPDLVPDLPVLAAALEAELDTLSR
jgi:diacylglycerol O-acyltransferase / wax synthase